MPEVMKLARKTTLALSAGIFAVMGAYAYVQTRQEVVLFEPEVRKNARVGRALRGTIEAVWRNEGAARARALVEEANDDTSDVSIHLVYPEAAAGDPRRPPLEPEQRAALARGEEVRVEHAGPDGEARRYTYVPLRLVDAPPAALEMSESLRPQRTFIRMNRLAIGLATLATTAVCSLIAMLLLLAFVTRPMRLLQEQARRLGAGDFSRRLRLRQRDEIGELAEELNAMCERMVEGGRKLATETDARIQALEQLRHTDRLATIGKLTSGVAHQLGTPLSIIALRAREIGSTDGVDGEVSAHASIIAEQAERMSGSIRQLLDFSRRRKPRLIETNLRELVRRTLELLAPVADKTHVALESDPPGTPLPVRVDESQMQQALTNVVLNAIQALPAGGRVRVATGTHAGRRPANRGSAEGVYWSITVEDEGPGIPPEELDRIFEPFFTTKGAGQGTGLGLPVADGIVSEHGGWIDVDSVVGRGSRFTIVLPQAAAARRTAPEKAAS
jgi:signal transduction histidine kinase